MSTKTTLPVIAAALLGAVFPALAQQPAPGANFPEGPGKSTVQAVCNGCHDINRLTAGYTPNGWLTVTNMMKNFGAPVPDDQWDTVRAYLIRSFPEKPRPPAVIIPGSFEVNIMEWPLPTPGSRPHDPAAGKDGSIWWTGQLANKIGHLDPKTGKFKEYPVNPMSAPHGLLEDKEGNIWFTGNFRGFIGKLDTKTGEVTEYNIPDPKAKDPHTLVMDHNGIIWFSVQNGNIVGRLDPKSGTFKLTSPPTNNARPYGLAVNSKNQVYFVEFGAPKVATIDDDMHIKEYQLPDRNSRPRRIAIDKDDIVWYTDFSLGRLGRLDPATGVVTEYQSPSGPKSQPYGIAATKGGIWYCESMASPNTIVRFDPKSERFQTWAIPGGGDQVRNMAVNPDGNVLISNTLVNQVGIVEVKSATN